MSGEFETQGLLRLPAVTRLTTLSRSHVYAKIAAGEFPRPLKLGARASAWRCSDIFDWIEQRASGTASDGRTAR